MKMNRDDYLERVYPEDSKLFQYVGDESESESVSNIEYRFKRKDGKYVWLKGRRIFFRSSNGKLTHSIGDFGDISKEKIIYDEKNKLEEKLKYMRDKSLKSKERVSLTERERLVLWGFCRYPLLNDEELAKKLDIKRSTLTAIKNRLKERKWFSFNYIPNFYKLGFQFFSIFFASFKKGKSKSLEFLKNTPEIILSNYQEDNFLGVFVSDKYVDFKRFLSNLIGLDVLKHGFGEDSFFYNLDNIALYDSSSFINFLFGLKRTKNSHVYKFENGKSELSINERRVLHEMVKNPEMSSAEIAKNIWVSKPTVIKVKKKLLDEGYIYPYVIPDFKKLGFSYIGWLSLSFDSEEFATITKESNDFQVILRVSGKNRMSKIMLFASVDEYEQEVNSIKEAYRKKGIDFKLKSEIFSMQKRRSSDSKMESFISDKLFGDEI